MNFNQCVSVIDEANKLFPHWFKCRKHISWNRLKNEVNRVKCGKKTTFPFIRSKANGGVK